MRTSTKGRLFRESISYSFNFKRGLCNLRIGYCPCWAPCTGGEQFMWFFKNDLFRFHLILLFFGSSKRLFFEMCLVRSTIANLCRIMIDFNECRSEEVMFLLTLGVVILRKNRILILSFNLAQCFLYIWYRYFKKWHIAFRIEMEKKLFHDQALPIRIEIMISVFSIANLRIYLSFSSTVKPPVFGTLNSAISNFQTWFVRTVMEVLKYCRM